MRERDLREGDKEEGRGLGRGSCFGEKLWKGPNQPTCRSRYAFYYDIVVIMSIYQFIPGIKKIMKENHELNCNYFSR